MSQTTRNSVVLIIVCVLLVAGVWYTEASRAVPAGQLRVAGDVRTDIRTVVAPPIALPTPDYTVGIPKAPGVSASMGGSKRGGGASSAARSGQPVVAGMLTRVLVREGDHVVAGQVIAELDTTMLELGVRQAQTAARKAREDVGVMGGTINKLNDSASKISSARDKIATAKKTLLKARAALLKARTQLLGQQAQLLKLKAQRPQLQAALKALKAQAATFPPGKVPPAITKQIAQLTKTLAMIDPGLAGIAKGLATVGTNLAKVNAGLAKLPAASAKINAAETKLADAKTQLRNARSVLEIVADAQLIGVEAAKARLAQAVVRAPVAGVVTFARRAGTLAMVGAPLARIAIDGPTLVDTYLTAEQAAAVAMGSPAEVAFDSAPGTVLRGTVSRVGSSYAFPPTSFPTQVVHMTRALKVTVELDAGADVPPGTPVDITLHTTENR